MTTNLETSGIIDSVAVAAGTYAVDTARSRIRFHATHIFGRGPVNGTFAILDGTFTVAADPARCRVVARIDATSFATDKARRDADVTSKKFLHAQEHPEMLFVSERVTRDSDRWTVHGQLTVHGLTSPVTMEIDSAAPLSAVGSTESDVDDYMFRAHARIDRYAYRVGPRGFPGRYVDLEFEIVGTPAG